MQGGVKKHPQNAYLIFIKSGTKELHQPGTFSDKGVVNRFNKINICMYFTVCFTFDIRIRILSATISLSWSKK